MSATEDGVSHMTTTKLDLSGKTLTIAHATAEFSSDLDGLTVEVVEGGKGHIPLVQLPDGRRIRIHRAHLQ